MLKTAKLSMVVGTGLLINGLCVLAGSGASDSSQLAGAQLALVTGGNCYYCDSLSDSCGTANATTCTQITEGADAGKYSKDLATGQTEAACATHENENTAGAATCNPPDTYMLCITEWVCTGIGMDGTCTGCSTTSTTVTVPTNCPMSGSCQSSS
jgi:hypothetical protein